MKKIILFMQTIVFNLKINVCIFFLPAISVGRRNNNSHRQPLTFPVVIDVFGMTLKDNVQ